MNRVLAPDDQRGFIARSQFPRFCVNIDQTKGRALVRLESPISLERCMNTVAKNSTSQGGGIDYIAALYRIGLCRQGYGFAISAGYGEREAVCISCGKCQRRTVDRQHERRTSKAENFLWVDRVQRRQLRRLDRRECNHQYRHGAVEGRRRIERQGELVFALRGQRRNILILRSAKRI